MEKLTSLCGTRKWGWLLHFDQTGKKKKFQLRDNCRRFKLVFQYYSP